MEFKLTVRDMSDSRKLRALIIRISAVVSVMELQSLKFCILKIR